MVISHHAPAQFKFFTSHESRVTSHESRVTRSSYTSPGGERGPVISAAFKAGDSVLRGSNGGFDFHTPPPSHAYAHTRNNVGAASCRATFRPSLSRIYSTCACS